MTIFFRFQFICITSCIVETVSDFFRDIGVLRDSIGVLRTSIGVFRDSIGVFHSASFCFVAEPDFFRLRFGTSSYRDRTQSVLHIGNYLISALARTPGPFPALYYHFKKCIVTVVT